MGLDSPAVGVPAEHRMVGPRGRRLAVQVEPPQVGPAALVLLADRAVPALLTGLAAAGLQVDLVVVDLPVVPETTAPRVDRVAVGPTADRVETGLPGDGLLGLCVPCMGVQIVQLVPAATLVLVAVVVVATQVTDRAARVPISTQTGSRRTGSDPR